MIVLSLFDGMSCGQIALKELVIIPETYYASEIDKHAIAQTQLNFPNTIQLGSVVNVNVSDLQPIDLLIGGSPCQSFSFAGKRKGMSTKCEIEITRLEQYLELKEQGFEFEGQSYLFWEYMRILNDIRKYNPNVLFLLENVEMGAKWERVLSEAIGVYGVHINSALVSAQNRKRIYWTNIRTRQEGLFGELHSDIPQPQDRGILLSDILESDVDEKYYLSGKMIDYLIKRNQTKRIEKTGFKLDIRDNYETKCNALGIKYGAGRLDDTYIKTKKTYEKASCFTAGGNSGGLHSDMDLICVKSINKDNLVMQINPSTESGGKQPYQQNIVYDTNGISPALMAQMSCGTHAIETQSRIRRLTPTECARLQTIPEWYIWACSDTQQYRMLGNGWTVKVIKHILSFMLCPNL